MKCLVFSFSATGNTARLVSLVSEELERAGHGVEHAPITVAGKPPKNCGDFDLVIVAFPVLAMMPPVFVRRYLRRLPSGRRTGSGNRVRAAVLAIDGGDGGPAAGRAASIMRRRGYEVFMSARAAYSENWVQVGAVPGSDEAAAAKTALGDARAREIARDLVEGKVEQYGPKAGLWLLGQLLGFLFGSVGRRFLGKSFIASEACSSCGMCARTCPAGTIVMGRWKRAKPYWRMNCENCNRCMNTCPKAAINTSIASVVLQFASITIFIMLGIRAVNELAWPGIGALLGGAGSAARVLLYAAAVVAAHILSLGPADYFIFRWLRRIPGLRKVFALTFSKDFRRYAAPGFKPEARGSRGEKTAQSLVADPSLGAVRVGP